MKNLKPYVLVLAGLIAISACSKTSSSSSAVVTTPTDSFKYTVNDLTDITTPQYQDTTVIVPVAIAYVSGTQEVVTLTPTNLPAGITVSPASISGTASYANSFSFNVNIDTPGTYPITIVASAGSTVSKTFIFNIIVSPSSNCIPEITGNNWKYKVSCSSPYSPATDSGTGYIVADIYGGTANTVEIVGASSSGFGYSYTYAVLNCTLGTFAPVASTTNLEGSGTFSNNSIAETYTVSVYGTTGITTSTCTATYTR